VKPGSIFEDSADDVRRKEGQGQYSTAVAGVDLIPCGQFAYECYFASLNISEPDFVATMAVINPASILRQRRRLRNHLRVILRADVSDYGSG